MGLPEIIINFKTLSINAIGRSQRGIVALILKDDTNDSFDTKTYTNITEIDASDWTSENKDYIEKTFLGGPSKVIAERLDILAEDYSDALDRLKTKTWNYLAVPGIETSDVAVISTWIKTKRDNEHKTYKAVLPNSVSDHEGIINFATSDIKVGTVTYTAARYCARIAGILAGMSFARSSTFYELPEVESITSSSNPDSDIDAGKLILINDREKIKIARGVNSLTTTSPAKGEIFKKIRIVEGIDLIHDDIRNTFNDSYVGKVINNYDNKVLFFAAVNTYFRQLGVENVLDTGYNNLAEVDIEAQRLYLESIGVPVSTLHGQEIKEYNTGSKVFAKAKVKFLDAIEDLAFEISM